MTAQHCPFAQFRTILASAALAAVFAAAAAPGGAMAQALEVSQRDCERLIKHSAAAGADYQPGVDVHGKPVAGADVDGGAGFKLPDTITIPISVDLAARYGMGADTAATAETAAVTVSPATGEVRLGGEPLDAGTESALRRACLETYSE